MKGCFLVGGANLNVEVVGVVAVVAVVVDVVVAAMKIEWKAQVVPAATATLRRTSAACCDCCGCFAAGPPRLGEGRCSGCSGCWWLAFAAASPSALPPSC